MTISNRGHWRRGLVLMTLVGLAASCAWAQDEVPANEAREATAEAIATRQQTQQQKDDWSDEKAALEARYRSAKANVAWLQAREAEELGRAEAIESRVAELGRRLDEADRLEGSMQDTLLVIFDRLEQSVDQSSPFLAAERQLRLESLGNELVRPDVTSAEKLRRLLESLQVEAGYASSVEVYQDRIMVAEQELHADILRFGRVALFWRTPDGERVGSFDQAADQWVDLPDRNKRNVALAMEMATRMRPVEIMDLPLGRIEP